MYWHMRQHQKGTVSSNSRFQAAVPRLWKKTLLRRRRQVGQAALKTPTIWGWIAVSAAGSHGRSSRKKNVFFPQTLVVAIIGMDRMVCTADRISKTTFDCLLPVVFRRSVQSSTQIASFTECTLVVFRTLWQSAIVQD